MADMTDKQIKFINALRDKIKEKHSGLDFLDGSHRPKNTKEASKLIDSMKGVLELDPITPENAYAYQMALRKRGGTLMAEPVRPQPSRTQEQISFDKDNEAEKLLAEEESKYQPEEPEIPVSAGIYLIGNKPVKVVSGQNGMYGMMREGDSLKWSYVPGAITQVREFGKRITLEQAEEMSLKLGVCMVCGKILTAKRSVKRNIGPVCIKKL